MKTSKIKKALLLFAIGLFSNLAVNAQCTPDPQYTNPGVYPDSATGFADVCVGALYDQLVTIIVPFDTTTLIGPFPVTLTFDSLVVVDIAGLPAGLTYNCYDAQNLISPVDQCTFEGGTTGCVSISGIPDPGTEGVYNLSVELDAYLEGGTTPTLSYTIDYYTFEVLPASFSTLTETACQSYTSPSGNVFTTSDTYLDTIPSATGCDSIITINLTVTNIDSEILLIGNSLASVESGASYQWLNCPAMTPITGETNQSFTPTANGDYAVEITKNGCVVTSNCFTVSNIGILENSFKTELLIYPNPTDGNFSIDLGSNYPSVNITITDVKGKVVQAKQYTESQLFNLSIEDPAGIYLLTIESKDKKAVIRVVKK